MNDVVMFCLEIFKIDSEFIFWICEFEMVGFDVDVFFDLGIFFVIFVDKIFDIFVFVFIFDVDRDFIVLVWDCEVMIVVVVIFFFLWSDFCVVSEYIVIEFILDVCCLVFVVFGVGVKLVIFV